LMVAVCCPASAPGTHWRTAMCRPSFEEDGTRGQRCFEGAEHHTKARCNRHLEAIDPQEVCGAATPSLHQRREIKSGHVARGQRRQDLHSGNKARNPLSGDVCLLTTGVLIRVRLPRPFPRLQWLVK